MRSNCPPWSVSRPRPPLGACGSVWLLPRDSLRCPSSWRPRASSSEGSKPPTDIWIHLPWFSGFSLNWRVHLSLARPSGGNQEPGQRVPSRRAPPQRTIRVVNCGTGCTARYGSGPLGHWRFREPPGDRSSGRRRHPFHRQMARIVRRLPARCSHIPPVRRT
jgi:hypothetical protein